MTRAEKKQRLLEVAELVDQGLKTYTCFALNDFGLWELRRPYARFFGKSDGDFWFSTADSSLRYFGFVSDDYVDCSAELERRKQQRVLMLLLFAEAGEY